MRSIILFILILLSSSLLGQKKFDFDFTGKTLFDAVEQLSKKHKFKFSYNPEALKTHKLGGRIRANSDAELLSKVFEDLPFKIQLSDGVYLVIPRKIKRTPLSLAGKVYDKDTGEPLAFAHVQTSQKGTISNQDGRFNLPPREDTITIQVSYIGYKDLQLKVEPDREDVALNLELNPRELQEVILNTSQLGELSGKPSFFSLNPSQFNALPTLGETDVFKSIQMLPGVRATDETASGLSVRGGTPSQNLVTMDGFTLYHLDHFFGIFSTLNPNVINNVSLYKGGFGPEYGGRISSVVDVSGKTGSKEGFSAKAGVNLLSFNGMIETPIGRKSSFLLGVRQSFTGVLNSDLFKDFLSSNRESFIESINPEVATLQFQPSLNFYDINGKFQHRFSPSSILDINLYLSEDFYSAEFTETDDFSGFNIEDRATWENKGISLNWKLNPNSNWHSNFTIAASEFFDEQRLDINQTFFQDVAFQESDTIFSNSEVTLSNFGVQSSVSDVTIKSDHEIDLPNDDLIKAGIELNAISTSYDADQFFFQNFSEEIVIRNDLILESAIASIHGSYQFEGSNIRSSIGTRGTFYEPTGKWFLEPRFDLNFKINENFNLKGAASLHHQFVNQTSLSLFSSDDKFYWVLADDASIPILKSSHMIFGANYSLGKWSIDLEYYRKNTAGILENLFAIRSPGNLDTQSLNSSIDSLSFDTQINPSGENISEGIDLFVKFRDETFTSWLSYSLGASNNKFSYIDQNNPFPSNQDQRHEINLVSILKLNNWELSSSLIYGSGRPYTTPILLGDSARYYDETKVNSLRLPSYFRVDLSAKYSFPIGKSQCEVGITFFNVFDKVNVKSRRFTEQFVFDEQNDAITEDQVRLVAIDTRLLGFTPNFFFNIRF
ncbi:MAG: TonB-dependent receptor [Cyclobacteriaceae bacterium]